MYQCCKEYSTVEDPTTELLQRETEYTFTYEFRADAELTFDKEGSKSKARCFFTSVYIDDIELVNKGLEEEEVLFENLGISVENLSIQPTEIPMQQMAESAPKNNVFGKEEAAPYIEVESKPSEEVKELNELNSNEDEEKNEEENYLINDGTDWANFGDNKSTHTNQGKIMQVAEVADKVKLEEQREKWNCRKNAQEFAEKIRKLEYEPGFEFDPTQSNLGQLEKVEYDVYPRTPQAFKHFSNIRRKRKTVRSRSNSRTPPTTSKSGSFETEDEEQIGNEDNKIESKELSFEEKLQFKFGYEPTRDRHLVAKLAKKFLLKDSEMRKYWSQRYRYFSLLDKGILMDKQCWFSVTPELLAKHVAERLVPIKGCTIFDPFAGSGCNSIQFALRGAFVYAVDLDPIKLLCANHNAKIYGASNRINFICGDFFHITHSMIGALEAKRKRTNGKSTISSQNDDPYPLGIDAVYLSPPWGGPSYSSTDVKEFNIERDMDLDGFKIFDTAKQISQNIAYFLPRNTSVNQLITLAGPGGFVELEQSRMNEKVKAMHAYYGRLVQNK